MNSKYYFPLTEKEANMKGIESYRVLNKDSGFAIRLQELRKRKGEKENRKLSQKEVSEALELSRSTIGLYENGENVPDVKTIVKIAEYYDTTVNYLLGIDERPNYKNSFIADKTGLSDEAISFLEITKKYKDNSPIKDEIAILLKTLNFLLSTKEGRSLINDIWRYFIAEPLDNIGEKNNSTDINVIVRPYDEVNQKSSFLNKNHSNKESNEYLVNDMVTYGDFFDISEYLLESTKKQIRAIRMIEIQERLQKISNSFEEELDER